MTRWYGTSSLTSGNLPATGRILKYFPTLEVGEILKRFFMTVLHWIADLRAVSSEKVLLLCGDLFWGVSGLSGH